MDGITGRVVLLCLQIIPVILLIGSIFAFWNVVGVGPRELPRKHPLNRKMALPVLVEAIGMFMLPLSNIWGTVGIVICVIGILWYAVYFREARKEYPPLTDAEWLKIARKRYGRMRDFDSHTQDIELTIKKDKEDVEE